MKVQPEPTPSFERQQCFIGGCTWSVARLATLSADLEVMDVPVAHLNVWSTYKNLTLRQMVGHMQCVLDADMSKPIILDEDGVLMDGRHRIMHAILNGHETIKAVRFAENPRPCEVSDE